MSIFQREFLTENVYQQFLSTVILLIQINLGYICYQDNDGTDYGAKLDKDKDNCR